MRARILKLVRPKSAAREPSAVSDRELTRRVLAGDREAFEEFFEGHFPGLYRFALGRLRDPELARDTAQTTICNAIANLGSFRGEAPLAGWLFTICRNEVRRHYRTLGRSPASVELVEEDPEVHVAAGGNPGALEGPEEVLRQRETGRRVHDTLDRLPSRYGDALEWKYVDGLSVKEIAGRLGLSPKAAESLLTRARQAFRDSFATATPAVHRELELAR